MVSKILLWCLILFFAWMITVTFRVRRSLRRRLDKLPPEILPIYECEIRRVQDDMVEYICLFVVALGVWIFGS